MVSKYVYKENIYEVVGPGKMKHPESGEWINAIIYKNSDGEVFIRERIQFFSKFERL